MSSSTQRLVLFDIDGTLVLTMGAGKEALRVALADDFGIAEPKVDLDYGGRTDRSIARELFEINEIEATDQHYLRLFESYLRELRAHLPRITGRLLPGVPELLDQMTARPHMHLGLLTGNIEQGAYVKLAHYEIDRYFHFGGFGDHHEARDDIAREGKKRAEQSLGLNFEQKQVFVIGDTPHDVTCARAIGARCIAVSTGYAPIESLRAAEPDVLLEDLSSINDVLAIIEG